MRAFDIDLDPSIIEVIAAQAERGYPHEVCGFVLGRAGSAELARVVQLENAQDRHHAEDPIRFPRTARDAFRMDELERMRVLETASKDGLVERVLYHSHCDTGAYLSPEDRAMAVRDGLELLPGIVHVVVAVRDGRRADAAAFRWDAGRKTFEEIRVPVAPEPSESLLPDLASRAMASREDYGPIRPLGGALSPRRVTTAEQASLAAAAERTRLTVTDEESLRDIRRFELGLYSPLAGFMRSVEVRAIEQSGRLLSGTPWRTPVVLELPRASLAGPDGADRGLDRSGSLPATGALVELLDAQGKALAVMGLEEILSPAKDRVRLGGPIFAYDSGSGADAAEVRAELLRRGLRKVLAIGPAFVARAEGVNLDEFDAVLAPKVLANAKVTLDLPLGGRDGWLDAVIAQNLGATHVWAEDPALARGIEDALEIRCWRPRSKR